MSMTRTSVGLTQHERSVLKELVQRGIVTSESDGLRRGVQLLEERHLAYRKVPA